MDSATALCCCCYLLLSLMTRRRLCHRLRWQPTDRDLLVFCGHPFFSCYPSIYRLYVPSLGGCVCAVLCRFLISMGNRFIWMIKASNVCLMIPNIKVRTPLQHKMRAQTQFKSPYNLAYLCICIQTATQYTMDWKSSKHPINLLSISMHMYM